MMCTHEWSTWCVLHAPVRVLRSPWQPWDAQEDVDLDLIQALLDEEKHARKRQPQSSQEQNNRRSQSPSRSDRQGSMGYGEMMQLMKLSDPKPQDSSKGGENGAIFQDDKENPGAMPTVRVLSGPPTMEEKEEEDDTCVVCLDEDISHSLQPCGHLQFCGTCAPTLKGGPCPICRENVTSIKKTSDTI
eukprot:CAMPEP_0167784268 /NCGR_PEP_ID=MMETSP0111_2-20121227/7542_1 /TAXON_ID=91324 /ORGANISM="Lotharella globosa, Strain CCCM811" /LENGTH=187 /DNA_ID=CAMNT_0007675319 /DNA_START=153 /DNA_END=716 /DNA_ORIENTATION=-